MSINKANYINTLINVEDKSNYKVHENLATDIISYIKETHAKSHNNEKTLPQIIGIEGPWGSGKSNLVKLIKNKFEKWKTKGDASEQNGFAIRLLTENESCSYHDFIFNIWENQGTSIEKAFLKYLLDDLISNKILTGKTTIKIRGIPRREKWTDIFDIFTAKKQYEKSFLWGALIIFVFLLAFFIKWFDPSNINFGLFSNYSFLFVFLCLLFLIGFSFKKFTTPFRLFPLKSAYTEVSSVGLYSEDFRNLFNNISRELQKQNKILIINFDNIDRCNNEKAQEVLSLIYTVFSENIYKNIWVILTYDYDKLAEVIWLQQKEFLQYKQLNDKILENNKVQESEDSITLTPDDSQENTFTRKQKSEDFVKYNYIDGFLNKVLPVIYKVPTNITLDYKKVFDLYFDEAFQQARSNIQLDKKYIYKLYRSKHRELIYRDIISFINQLVLYSNRRKAFRDIDLFTLAIYILYEKELKQGKDILSFNFPDNVDIIINESGVTNINVKLAAILYQVDVGIAVQLQIIKHIEKIVYTQIEQKKSSSPKKSLFPKPSWSLTQTYTMNFSKEKQEFSFSIQNELSKSIFDFIEEDIFPQCWCYCCNTFSTEYLMKGIVSWCIDYKDRDSFQELLAAVVNLKIKEDQNWSIKNPYTFPFYTYLILFRCLKNKVCLKALLEQFYSYMNIMKQNLNKDNEFIAFYIWVFIFLLYAIKNNELVNKNNVERIKKDCQYLINSNINKFFDGTFKHYKYLDQCDIVKFLGVNFNKIFQNFIGDWSFKFTNDRISLYDNLENWAINKVTSVMFNKLDNEKDYNNIFELFCIFDFIEQCNISNRYKFLNLHNKISFLITNYQLKTFFSVFILGSLCRFYRQTLSNKNKTNNLNNIFSKSQKKSIINRFIFLLSSISSSKDTQSTISPLSKEKLLALLEITILCFIWGNIFFHLASNYASIINKSLSIDFQSDKNYFIKEIHNMLSSGIYGTASVYLQHLQKAKVIINTDFPNNSLFRIILEALEI